MPPLRLKESDLRRHPDLLLRQAGDVAAVVEAKANDPGADRPAGGVRGRQGGQKGRGGRFRLTQPEPPEAAVLKAVKRALELHPRVAWVERLNSGAGQLKFSNGTASQWMRFSWRGAPDLIGQTVDGLILCVECKRPSGRLRPDQEAFLNTVRCQGGVAFVARSIDDVRENLG